MSENARKKGRMAIYAMAGVYLLFMAYNLVQDLSFSTGNERILMIVFIIFFGIVGVGMIVMGTVMGYKLSKHPNVQNRDVNEVQDVLEASEEIEKGEKDEAKE